MGRRGERKLREVAGTGLVFHDQPPCPHYPLHLAGRGQHPTQPAPAAATSPVAVELHVSGHLAVRHRVRQLLQLQGLEVHTLALVGHDEVRVQRALGAPGLIPGQGGEDRSPELPASPAPRESTAGVGGQTGPQQARNLWDKLRKALRPAAGRDMPHVGHEETCSCPTRACPVTCWETDKSHPQ